MADESGFDDLDECVEAHVHGPVRFDSEVEALVLDPCFADTEIEQLAERLGCSIEFHPGFRASPDSFDPEYRGAHIVDLARSLGDELPPKIVGGGSSRRSTPAAISKQVWIDWLGSTALRNGYSAREHPHPARARCRPALPHDASSSAISTASRPSLRHGTHT